MSYQCSTAWCDGERVTLLAPFTGSGSGIAEVGAAEYCATMRAYYCAFAAACRGESGGLSWCSRDAGVLGGKHIGGSVGCVATVGGNVGTCGCGDESNANNHFVSGRVVERGRSESHAGSEGSSCEHAKSVVADNDDISGRDGCVSGPVLADCSVPEWRRGAGSVGKNYARNKRKREASKRLKALVSDGSTVEWRRGVKPLGLRVDASGGCISSDSGGSVCTVDTRTEVEIEAARTLAARRVAENRKFEVEAKVAQQLAEHRLKALQDKDRTTVVERLAAVRYEQRINEARLKAQKSFAESDSSLKSLGSMGSAGELHIKQSIKKAKDNEKILKYVQDQAKYLLQHATPEVRRYVAEMPGPVFEDEFEVFGDCAEDCSDDEREAYYEDLNCRNAEHGMVSWGSTPSRRELSPEEMLKVEEEIRALSVY